MLGGHNYLGEVPGASILVAGKVNVGRTSTSRVMNYDELLTVYIIL